MSSTRARATLPRTRRRSEASVAQWITFCLSGADDPSTPELPEQPEAAKRRAATSKLPKQATKKRRGRPVDKA